MIYALFLFGTWPFWAYIVLFSVIEICLLEFERPGWATFSTMLFLGLLAAFSNVNPAMWVYHNPLLTAYCVVGWFIAGTLWAVFKWYFYVSRISRAYNRARTSWLANKNNGGVIPPREEPPRYPAGQPTAMTGRQTPAPSPENLRWWEWQKLV